ncbi:MAG: methyltransferase domain-containing protein [Planctomycetota bacterium]|nr:methyltransferase domain-containing protein [Planctomycetota bacterium]
MTRFPDPQRVPAIEVAGFRAVWRAAWPDALPGFGVYVLEDPDAPLEALDEAEFEATDERLPYFASLWPAGDSLTAHVLTASMEPGRRVLDLGCGVGSAGLAAAVHGADVTFVDWDPRALELVERSAAVLGIEPAALVVSDWRALEPSERYDHVLGADLLYEARNVPAVLAMLARCLGPGAEAWIADPGRDGLDAFLEGLGAHGLKLEGRRVLPHRAHGVTVTCLCIASAPESPPVP